MSALLTHEGTPARTAEPAGRGLWHRIRRTVQEMNHAARRAVELQAPWSVDKQWHAR